MWRLALGLLLAAGGAATLGFIFVVEYAVIGGDLLAPVTNFQFTLLICLALSLAYRALWARTRVLFFPLVALGFLALYAVFNAGAFIFLLAAVLFGLSLALLYPDSDVDASQHEDATKSIRAGGLALISLVCILAPWGIYLANAPEPEHELIRLTMARERPQIISEAISRGAEINVTSNEFLGSAPLHLAVEHSELETVKILLDAGADPNIKESGSLQRTALHIATTHSGELQVLTALVNAGANLEASDAENRTPLEIAIRLGNSDAAEFLIHSGAEIPAPGASGRTALHWAVSACKEHYIYATRTKKLGVRRIVQLLISLGVDPQVRDVENRTAGEIADEFCHNPLVSDLLGRGD